MKKTLLALAAIVASPLLAAEPNVVVPPERYGRIDTNDFPQPALINDQPVTLQQGAGGGGAPLYLHVPQAHSKRWDKYCQRYDACGRPVYFVRDDWFKNVYTPRYDARHPRSETPSMDRSDRPRDERGTDADRDRGNLERTPGDRGSAPPKKGD